MPRSLDREMSDRGYSRAACRDLAELWVDRFGDRPVALADLLDSDLRPVLVRAAGEAPIRSRHVRAAEDSRIAGFFNFLAGEEFPRHGGSPPTVLRRTPGEEPAYVLRETVDA
jgi:hypothetical protein